MSLRLILTQAQPPLVTAALVPLAALRTQGRAALANVPSIASGEVSD